MRIVIFLIIPFFLLNGDYYGGDGVVRVRRGEWVSGNKINLNINDSLYFVVSNIGGVRTPEVFGAVPKPMNNGTGLWSVIFTNPTPNPITISQVDIIQPDLNSLFNGVSGVKPISGWTLIGQHNARWSGTIIIPAHAGFDFICQITGTGNLFVNSPIRLIVTTNAGTFEDSSFSVTSESSTPYNNIAFITDSPVFYISGLYSNTNSEYQLKLFESSNIAPIDSGTNLMVTIPQYFNTVAAGIDPDFTPATIIYDSLTGWNISTSLLRSLQNDSALFRFSAVNPAIGGRSLYPFDVLFGEACGQAIVQVSPQAVSGDSGLFDTVSLSIVCPDPMGRNTYGIWGGILVNPTSNAILVNQFEILGSGNIFNNVAGLKPQSSWTRVNFNCIRWTGSILIPPRGAAEFLCHIKGNNRNAFNVPITFIAYTNQGNYLAYGSTNQSRGGIPYANLYYLVGGTAAGLISGIPSNGSKTFSVRVAETGRASIPTGTALQINVPRTWSNIVAPINQPGFGSPIISGDSINGWTITTITNVNINNSYRDFTFTARAPAVSIDAQYPFPTYLTNTATTPNINAICEAVACVLDTSGGIIIDHISPSFIEPVNLLSWININLVSRASVPQAGFLLVYNFNTSEWENIASGMADTIETQFSGLISSNLYQYLNPANQILVRHLSSNRGLHTFSEDFLCYRVSDYYVNGIDLAPSLVNRGQDSIVMMRLNFHSGSASHGIDTLKIYLAGTGVDGDISAIKLFDDLNYNGFLDPGEPQLGTTQVFNLGTATFVGNPLFVFSNIMPKSILIVYTISNLATLGNYVGVDIMGSNDIITSNGLPVPGDYPISSSLSRITVGAPTIHWCYAVPDSIAPDSLETTTIFARVTDPQGPANLQRVKVDCQPIGGDSVVLLFDDGTHGDSIPVDSIYTRDSIIVMTGVLPGDYYLWVEAMNMADTCTRRLLRVFIKDIYPPQFYTQILHDTTFTGPFLVRSEIVDFSGIFTDSLYYRVNQGLFDAQNRDSISGEIYHYTIPAQNANDTIYYYLSALDNRGNRGTDPSNAPDSLYQFIILPGPGLSEHVTRSKKTEFWVYPNPARNRVNIYFDIEPEADVLLKIYDITGRLIRSFDHSSIIQFSRIVWDGTDDQNRKISNGVYFILLGKKSLDLDVVLRKSEKIVYVK